MLNSIKARNIKLFPFERFTIRSSKNNEEVISFLDSQVSRNIVFMHSSNHGSYKEYEGIIDKKGFRVKRIWENGHNGFQPIAIGKFDTNGKDIKVVIRPNKFLMMFSIVSIFFMLRFISSLSFHNYQNIDWDALFFFLITYLPTILFFNYESRMLKEDLLNYLI